MKTRILLLIPIFILSFNLANAQKEIDKKWTIGAILVNEGNFYNFLGGQKVRPNYFNGITIKRHFKSFTTRIGMEYTTEVYKPEKAINRRDNTDGYINEGIIRLGIEKGFVIKERLRPYFALDLSGLMSNSDFTSEYSGCFSSVNERVISKNRAFGAMPALGLECKITKKISLSLETRLRFLFNSVTSDIDNLYDDAGYYREKNKYNSVTLNRIGGVTLNVRF